MTHWSMGEQTMHVAHRIYAAGIIATGLLCITLCSCQGVPLAPAESASVVPGKADPPHRGDLVSRVAPGVPARSKAPTLSLSDQATARQEIQPASHTVAVLPYEVPQAATLYSANAGPRFTPPALPCQAPPTACGTCMATARNQWIPPGLSPPWPQDEYLCDGGDKIPAVRVNKDWSVAGLGLEDAVVHYDTLDGQTRVEPTNRVCVYAPRFAAVRKVYGLLEHESHQLAAGVELPTGVRGMGDAQTATTAVQPLQPELDRGTLTASAFRDRLHAPILENRESITAAQGALLPYENFTLIRDGQMDNSEKARLAQHTAAAAVWSRNKAVQILIDNIAAHVDAGSNAPSSVHVYKMHGKSRLRVCKVASRQDARPGEIVEFTLRFDNVGDQLIGNVTVMDNLTTRLEYVEGSQTCSVKANFTSATNQGDSLTLRWEITEPLKVAQGGVIRFKCRVR